MTLATFVRGLAISTLVATVSLAYSQSGSSTQGSMAPSEVALINPFSTPVHFSLECGDGDWTAFTLPAGNNGRYNCPDNAAMTINVVTQGFAPVVYNLPYKNRYQFFWRQVNQTSSYIDLSKITN